MKLATLPDVIGSVGLFVDGDWVESKDQDPHGDVRLVQLADVGDGEYLDKSSRFMTSEKAAELRCTYLKPGDILVARMPDPIGRACIFPGDEKPCVTVVDVCIIRSDPSIADAQWLVHMINSASFRAKIEPWVVGATRQRISRGNLSKLEFHLPKVDEQERIAAILDKADAIRRKRKQAVQFADEFLRSVFLDMFGDPVTNPKGWIVFSLAEVTQKIGSGATPRGGKEAYVTDGIALIRSLNVHDDQFLYKDLANITDQQADNLGNVVVEQGDVLLNITGASVCRCAIVPRDVLPARVNQHVCIVRPDEKRLTSDYLLHVLIASSFKTRLLGIAGASGATREALTKQQIENLKIPVPPVEVQLRFQQIRERLSVILKIFREKSELPLFKALSQCAFRGELQ